MSFLMKVEMRQTIEKHKVDGKKVLLQQISSPLYKFFIFYRKTNCNIVLSHLHTNLRYVRYVFHKFQTCHHSQVY